MKKLSIVLLCGCLTFSNISVYATDFKQEPKEETAGVIYGTMESIEELINQYRFTNPGGQGFAAEEGNNLIDILHGEKASVIGYDNATNGADRLIKNIDGSEILIQDKYFSTASRSVADAFKNGQYKYINPDGSYQQLEVPYDQYDDAIIAMEKRIINGEVPGIVDPEEAKNLVRQGSLTFEQSVNLTKAGTIESLHYDAAQGVIAASSAFGISVLISYAVNRMNGMDRLEAIKSAGLTGAKTGLTVFGTTVICGQLAKTGLMTVFEPSSEALVATFGDDFANSIIKIYGGRAGWYSGTAGITKQAAALLRTQGLVSVVTIAVMSLDDVANLIEGEISTEQMLVNLANTGTTVVFGQVGYYLGSLGAGTISGGWFAIAGGIVGATAFGWLGNFASTKITGMIYEGDASIMIGIISEVFQKLCVEYVINEEEATTISKELSQKLTGKKLKKMFASKDKYKYAENLMRPLFDEINENRSSLDEPTVLELRNELISSMDEIIYIH